MRVHDLFHASLLKPYVRGANVQPPPMPIVVNGKEWFEVNQILNHRDRKIHVRKATKQLSTLQRNSSCNVNTSSNGAGTVTITTYIWEPASMVAALDALKEYLAYRTRTPNPVA